MSHINFTLSNGEHRKVVAPLGLSVMEITKKHDFSLEAACGGSMACATCHVIVKDEWFNKLPPASEEEETILDVAFGIQRTSRLGCQIRMTEDLDGMEITLVDERNGTGFSESR